MLYTVDSDSIQMKTPKFKPVFFNNRPHPWVITIPPYLSPSGRIQRRFFVTKDQAKAFGDYMRRQYEDHLHDSTYLTRDQLAEAGKAYKLIDDMSSYDMSYSLLQIVQDFVDRQRLASTSVPLDCLIDEYRAARAGASKQYLADLQALKDRLPQLGHRIVSTLTPADIESAVRRETPSVRNSHLRFLRAMFNWSIKRGYLTTNPVAKLEFSVLKRKEVQTYKPEDVQKLLDDCLEHDLELLPYRVFSLFCGIRPRGEMSRLTWDDINWADHVVKLRASITKKGRARFPVIHNNARQWLEQYRARGGQTTGLVVGYTQKVLDSKLRANHQRTRVKSGKNLARHSFCSFHLAYFNDVNGLCLQSGHQSTQVLWSHYYQAARKEDAERFWSVIPKTRTITNVIAMTN
jgi:integrase